MPTVSVAAPIASEVPQVHPQGPAAAVLEAVALFRALQLEAALSACHAAIAAAAGPADEQVATRALAAYWGARCARRLERPDEALRLLYAGLAAASGGPHGRTECMLRAELTHALSALGLNEDAVEQADAAQQRAVQLKDPEALAVAQEALASVHWMTEDWRLGHKAYRSALAAAEACGHLELRVLCTMGLAATEDGVAGLEEQEGRAESAQAGCAARCSCSAKPVRWPRSWVTTTSRCTAR